MFKGQQLAAEEITRRAGSSASERSSSSRADEKAGTDANVKELRRLEALREHRFFCGINLHRHTPALGPVARS